ncbi:putative RNA-directed DNA polymerase, eukaryota, reverse transcriptase zinc-binding domain protein, partial [Tanacetum coccineum]
MLLFRCYLILGVVTMVEGNWITNPCLIKDAFLQFYKRKFQAQDSQVMFSNLPHSHSLNCMDRETLERQVTLEEIKEAVWDGESSKAPGPDGYSFAFVKKYWGTIQKDLYDFVNLFFASCVMPNGANSSFFTLIPKVNNPTLITDFRPISLIGIHYKIIAKILANRLSKVIDKIVSKEQSAFIAGRQILDGPVILSEIIEWYKKRKKKLLIFKVDFEKAFDSISWNYLIHILDSFGFGNKWCSWIKACLNSSRASILINGSPTSEFSIKRGLRQGDPLSPFLFILVMEGLHNAFEEAVGNGLITGVNIKNSTINVSHLFYADDVIITTDWNAKDMDNIIRVLHVFYLASGLKINIHKSNIYGIGVNKDEVLSMASNAGCMAGDVPFNYLGLPIGSNMKSIASWKTLVDRFHMRLSSWKANLLSIGGRLTLIKSVLGSLGIYYLSIFRAPESVLQDLERIRANFFWGGNKDKNKMAWVKWPIILNSFDKGGLNIGSLKAFNLALLQKWRWRLLSSPNALWVQVIKAYHGQEGGFDTNGCSFKGIWANITLERNRKTVALEEINSIEKRIDEGSAMPSDNDHRLILLQEIEKIDKFASMDIIQKAHVKWDIEGDENSKFFHGLINQKRRNQMINGIMVEGNWITNPCLIKDAFLQFYKRKFQAQDSQVMFSNLPHSHSLNCMDRETLERQVTLEEIKEAVWDCGSSKAPGPDGYSFAFVKKYWGTIQKDLYDFVNLFFASCVMPNGANSSFFTLILK